MTNVTVVALQHSELEAAFVHYALRAYYMHLRRVQIKSGRI